MIQFATTSRRSLFLYGLLLVLPTLIFGWLYWSELQKDFERDRAAIPAKALNDAEKIAAGMRERLQRLLESENQRPFTDYSKVIAPEDVRGDQFALQPTPFEKTPAPAGVLGWYSYPRNHPLGPDSPVQIFVGETRGAPEDLRERLRSVVQDFRRRKPADSLTQRLSDVEGTPQVVSLTSLALTLGGEGSDECVQRCRSTLQGKTLEVGVSDFTLTFYRAEGQPIAIASRRVYPLSALEDPTLVREAPCLGPLSNGASLKQGFVLDVNWLFRELPWDIASRVLDEEEELRIPPEALPIDRISSRFADIFPVRDLGFDTLYEEDLQCGRLEIVIDDVRFEERVARQSKSFLTTGGMLLVTLAIGMTLLYRSVRRELDQAHRMQNFVAAVTHELRTPISTIRLHAEMLQDGWVDSTKQPEYYARIVRETQRLSTLVERVLEKSRLKENVTRPVKGDLNSTIEALRPDLVPPEGAVNDVTFQLEAKLPAVWMTAEGVGMIVSNLVENARKYAPAKDEPLVLRTRWSQGRVLLEVLDRGPGVPPAERERIFEAFYRIGREETRTTTGTGLGLHLVRLHAETCGATATVEPREGGGSVFRVAFRPAD